MLMIVGALGGTTYLYVSDVFTGKTAATFEIIDAVNDTVTIRNSGTGSLASFNNVKIDGNDAVYRVSKQDSSLVGYWKMDEGSGSTIADSSGNMNTGNLTNMNTTGNATSGWNSTDCKFGNCMKFDGINDRIVVSHGNTLDFDNSTSFTLSFWLKYDALRRQFMFDTRGTGQDGWAIETSVAGTTISMGGRDDDSTGFPANGVSITDLGWHFYSFVLKRGVGLSIYKDGVLGNGPVLLTGIDNFTETSNFTIGDVAGGGFPCACLLDSVTVYRRALSEQEIKAEYDLGSQINSGEIATIKIYNQLSKGTHTLRLCTSSICNTAILTVQ
ncbi:MAG: LamG domain-containing protein [Candidatus Aenigmarchaeota archaeon]|nr:LamG domain-containing protein [Candidatus Aenigmarchaeota archaeon]